ncbi:hypothetical protein SALCHL_003291 [Streptomyces albus subsp. chlorinus]|uniref:hypothetical protein n=1 Tax=Streptomyces albus TaxID=1888 RepID=UPI0015701C62|nr:hypothetical protein [Streptomyces albus]
MPHPTDNHPCRPDTGHTDHRRARPPRRHTGRTVARGFDKDGTRLVIERMRG